MTNTFGGQTVTIVHYTQTGSDALGAAIRTPTRTVVNGCRHRPLVPMTARGGAAVREEEQSEMGVAVATEWWQTTMPPVPAALAATAADALEVDGHLYQIVGGGVHPFTDMTGRVVKVTIHSERQTIGY